jgi:hypothetical protein
MYIKMSVRWLKRFGVAWFAASLLFAGVGVTASWATQCPFPSTTAATNTPHCHTSPPCSGLGPRCVGVLGCIGFMGLPLVPPVVPANPLVSGAYPTDEQLSSGLSPEPDRPPPITSV